jgi:hypothetical protein
VRFELIRQDNLRESWPAVKRGLERVLTIGKEYWLTEDVYAHLRMNLATLYLGFADDRYLGFFIAETKREPYTNESYVNVWILFAEPQNGENHAGVAEFVQETIAYIDEIARKLGVTRIRMSGREGWKRFLKGYFEPVKTEFERVLP